MQAGQSPSISSDSSMGKYSSPHLAQVAGIAYIVSMSNLYRFSIDDGKRRIFAQHFYNLSLTITRAMRIATSKILSESVNSARSI